MFKRKKAVNTVTSYTEVVQEWLDASVGSFTDVAETLEDVADIASGFTTEIDDTIEALIIEQNLLSDVAYRARAKAVSIRQFAAI